MAYLEQFFVCMVKGAYSTLANQLSVKHLSHQNISPLRHIPIWKNVQNVS